MFLVNSRYRHFSATPLCSRSESLHITGAHLFPKLRCKFAEFLNQSSLKRLGIFSPPTSVGFRYGHLTSSPRGFSWKHGLDQFRLVQAQDATSHLGVLITRLPSKCPKLSTYLLEPSIPSDGWSTLLRPLSFHHLQDGSGILT